MYCAKMCYGVANKTTNKQPTAWNKDGTLGPDNPHHSMAYLIAWLIVPDNVAKWRGLKDNARKKIFLVGLRNTSTHKESGMFML